MAIRRVSDLIAGYVLGLCGSPVCDGGEAYRGSRVQGERGEPPWQWQAATARDRPRGQLTPVASRRSLLLERQVSPRRAAWAVVRNHRLNATRGVAGTPE